MRRALPWSLSLGVHAGLLLALVALLGGGHRHAPDPEALTRLVWIEPAPPPAPPLGGGSGAAPPAQPEAPPAPVSPPVAAVAPDRLVADAPAKQTPAPPPKTAAKPTTRPKPVAVAPPPAPAPAIPAPALDAGVAAAGDASGVAGGTGTVRGGTADGVPGGVVGGLGDAPLALAAVASPPVLIDRVTPEYPRRARAQDIEGQVVLEVVLDRAGRVEDSVRVLRSIPALDAAAVAAVRQWRFRPARDREGRTVRVVMEIPVRFVLR